LNTRHNNFASWDLRMGLNTAFEGLQVTYGVVPRKCRRVSSKRKWKHDSSLDWDNYRRDFLQPVGIICDCKNWRNRYCIACAFCEPWALSGCLFVFAFPADPCNYRNCYYRRAPCAGMSGLSHILQKFSNLWHNLPRSVGFACSIVKAVLNRLPAALPQFGIPLYAGCINIFLVAF